MTEKDDSPENSSSDLPHSPPEEFTDSYGLEPRWKTQFTKIRKSFAQKLSKESLKKSIQNFDPQATLEWMSNFVQKRGTAFYGTLATVLLSTYFLSDLTALLVGELIPAPGPARNSRVGENNGRPPSLNDLNIIFSRNLFNSRGLIPGDEAILGANSDVGGPAVKTSLPINLIGTLIMSNELYSIATIEDKTANSVFPVRVDDEIPNKLKVIQIEARRVTFINTSSGRKEYAELPEEAINNPKLTPGKGGGPGVEKVASTQYNVSRTEVDKALSDFNNILTQARAVPNFENGTASGYKLFQIVPGSIYDKLGLQNGDVISGLNGQPINDPGKAFEMLNELKTSSHLELQVKKDGKLQTYTYDIH